MIHVADSGAGNPQRAGGAEGDAPSGRLGLIDALRGLAAATVVLHHLCSYGPLPDRAAALVPQFIEWTWNYGRMAVQVFLVISGFVTALALGRTPIGPSGFLRFAARRYVRLGFPYGAALLYLLALWALIPPRLAAFPLFDAFSVRGLLAHAAFLQDILRFPSLSAGIWYLAIDFQFGLFFYAILLGHRGLVRAFRVRSGRGDAALLVAVALPWPLASVFAWNLVPENDIWVVYYLGSLFLGAFGAWALAGRVPRAVFWLYVGAIGVGLALHWRTRLALALATGLVLYGSGRANWRGGGTPAPLRALGRISYSLYLVHYPTTWAVQSLGSRLWDGSPAAALLGMGAALVASLLAAAVLYRLVERPSLRLAGRLRLRSGAAAGDRP
jgi:peptidoglycan/LPS O-acetylase OafA/YrhL